MVLNNFIDYDTFKSFAEKEDLDMIHSKEDQQLSFFNSVKKELTDRILEINRYINIAVFSSSRCPDAATATPLLIELSKLNNKIHINFYDKDKYQAYLLGSLNETKIPTFLNLDSNGNIISKYCEFPLALKRILSDIEFREDADKIISDFRSGKYNKELLNELIDLILGCEQTDYISFDKTILPYRNENSSSS